MERELKRGSFPVASKAAWIEIANGSSVELHRVDGDGILRHLLYTAPETPYPGIAGVSNNPSRLRQRFAHPDLSVVNSWLHEEFAADVREFTLQTGPEGIRIKSTGDLCALLEGALGLDIGLYWQADDHTHATAAACLLACEMSGVRPESLRGGWGYDPWPLSLGQAASPVERMAA